MRFNTTSIVCTNYQSISVKTIISLYPLRYLSSFSFLFKKLSVPPVACNAVVKTKDGAITGVMHNHMHNPDNDEINAVKASSSMRRRSQDTAEPTQRILNDRVQDLPQATLVKLGKTETIHRSRNSN